jgi:hypothetical protein
MSTNQSSDRKRHLNYRDAAGILGRDGRRILRKHFVQRGFSASEARKRVVMVASEFRRFGDEESKEIRPYIDSKSETNLFLYFIENGMDVSQAIENIRSLATQTKENLEEYERSHGRGLEGVSAFSRKDFYTALRRAREEVIRFIEGRGFDAKRAEEIYEKMLDDAAEIYATTHHIADFGSLPRTRRGGISAEDLYQGDYPDGQPLDTKKSLAQLGIHLISPAAIPAQKAADTRYMNQAESLAG